MECDAGQDVEEVDNKDHSSEYYKEHGEEISLPQPVTTLS